MTEPVLNIRAAYASRQGRRPDNQDFAGISHPRDRELALHGAVLAVADGMGGAAGGRVAAELCVRCFLEAWYALPETLGMESRVARALVSVNRWIHDLGRRAPELAGMGCTFSALILRGRRAYLVHVGDSRVYRLRGDSVEQLSEDHNLSGPDRRHILSRAIGLDADLRIDYQEIPLEPHDRFLLCSDGLYEALQPAEIGRILMERTTADATAATLADQALDQGGGDNITALVGDVLSLPEADRRSIRDYIAALPLREVPTAGSAVDGFLLKQRLSTGRYSVLFLAEDLIDRRTVVLKFPQPRVATEQEYCDAFLREAWIGARTRSHWVAEVLEQPASRQSCLYSVMPHYPGRTLEQHLARGTPCSLEWGIDLALKLCKAVHALHRQQIVHRDIKPENIQLTADGGLKLLDLGIARLPAWDEDATEAVPGTPSYMAPELFRGERGSTASDVFAVGVTLYRMFSHAYPFGEIEPFTSPRFTLPKPLTQYRPDLPSWLDDVLARALAADPAKRPADTVELGYELETGLARAGGKRIPSRSPPLYERNPLLFWKLTTLALLLALLACLYP